LTGTNVTFNVGFRVDPPGIVNPVAKTWLKVGRELTIGAEFTDITDIYEYNRLGWSDDYPNGTEV